MNFQDLGLSEAMLRAVLMEGYTTPTPIQSQSIPHIMNGSDVLGCAQTGTGKTAAFALPVLHRLMSSGPPKKGSGRRTRVLILASTRELAQQICDSFIRYGEYTPLRVAVIYGGVGQGAQVRQLAHGVDILVATPGRLMDLMDQGYVDLQSIETLILDEADRMLDMGFLPAIRSIVSKLPRKRQTLLFSATMPDPIAELAGSILHQPIRISIEPERKTTELVDQSVCFVGQKQKLELLAQMIEQLKPTRTLVFTRTKYGADRIAQKLVAAGIKADAIHSNKSQNKRLRLLEQFKWENPPVLVATDIAARGIDVEGVSHVFNFDLPHEPETYVHRIGRSGRAGATGSAISFCDHSERKLLREIEKLLGKKIHVAVTLEEESAGTYAPDHARTSRGRTSTKPSTKRSSSSKPTARKKLAGVGSTSAPPGKPTSSRPWGKARPSKKRPGGRG